MKSSLLYICLILFSISCLYSQQKYEYWGDDYFENPNRDSTQKAMIREKLSAGFFPEISTPMMFYWLGELDGWDYSTGSFLLGDIYPKNTNSFFAQPENNKIPDKMEQKKPFSKDDKYGWLSNGKSRENFNFGIRFEYPFNNLRTIISVNTGVKTRYITAYSPVSIGEFTDYSGNKKTFEKMSFAEINDQHIYFNFDLKHPIYGFSNSKFSNNKLIENIEMFYYLIYGAGLTYSYLDKINVFEYILTNQDVLRFTSGEIREPSVFKENFDAVHTLRYHYNIGVGVQYGGDVSWVCNIELIYRQSMDYTIKDSDYKHNILFLRTGISMPLVIHIVKFYYDLFF